MGKKKQSDYRQFALIGYVGFCVVMVLLTLGLAFTEDVSQENQAPDPTTTLSPLVLTMQAEGYEGDHDHHGEGQGRRARATASAAATSVLVPTLDTSE